MLQLSNAEAIRKAGLAQCPFCNNDAIFVKYMGGFLVKCPVCDCMMARQISIVRGTIIPFQSEDQAAKQWNERLGVVHAGRKKPDGGASPSMLERREQRVVLIVDCLKRRKGELLHAKDIAADTGINSRAVSNLMHYIKKIHPEVTSSREHLGYTWKEDEK